MIVHSEFDGVYHDIALVRLARRVVFTRERAPIW